MTLENSVLRLAESDEVGVATRDLASGTVLETEAGPAVEVRANVPRGHKIALADMPAGAAVHKYGQSIGRALTQIRRGDHVHTHNLGMDQVRQDYEFGTSRVTPQAPAGPRPTFQGYRRANGKAGTRNYVGILTSVNCSASTARMIADQFRGAALDAFPNVDGVFALTHGSGCGMVLGSAGAEVLVRTLRGYAHHPNFAGLLVLGLGCEMLQTERFLDADTSARFIERLTIQDSGGIRATVKAGVGLIQGMLPSINQLQRETVDVSELVLGLNCGGSDGYSGITANPALGVASDLLVAYGGTSVLAETPEVFGAEHLLTRRAVAPEVGQRLLDQLVWWQEYTTAGGGSLDNNPSPGNKAGGLTTILEKSLGAVAKAGQAELSGVYGYAEPITSRGLVFMDTPGYDPVSVTGIVAGGANVVCFTTGRGSVFGCKPVPSIKLGTNTELYNRMPEDLDLNCGVIVDGDATVQEVGEQIFARILAVASGEQTVSEELDLGQEEFVPWQLGTVT
ncbi:altronate hydrolase [Arthrobacter sp. V4I6]|uniref:UxaA family hydrolase n=1 Tax=unclassified Arthrobacter TaxID=235627 RepID=UPI00277E1B74|nr:MULTISPECIES: altronate dehydratase family protein [unclassified Arthrobacter]MDQ0823213.1 altronate hydrolase [Arthrobacter sp. V1I7]MDQ0852844.1 altronate hydrolase [Arthrobacter sp. V4I6]